MAPSTATGTRWETACFASIPGTVRDAFRRRNVAPREGTVLAASDGDSAKARRRGPESTGFKFFAWDQEISNNSITRTHTSWGPLYAEVGAPDTPTYVYSRCRANAEFRQFFADRVQRHLFNDGALTLSNNLARWDARIAEVDQAVVAESARWGDYQRPTRPYTREVEFLSSNNWTRTIYWPSNHTIALKRFRDAGLFSLVAAPLFSQHGGAVPDGYSLSITNPNSTGTIYFTTDGADPRLRGGSVAPGALTYAGAVTLTAPTLVRARVKSGAAWSPLLEAPFFTPQNFTQLQLSEIYYHPPDDAAVDGDEFEFVEFKNTGTKSPVLWPNCTTVWPSHWVRPIPMPPSWGTFMVKPSWKKL